MKRAVFSTACLAMLFLAGALLSPGVKGGERQCAHSSVGTSSPSVTWYLAEGSTMEGFETWIAVQNPGNNPASAGLVFMTEAVMVEGPTLNLPPHSRASVNVADHVRAWSVSTMVTADKPVVAERSLYWSRPDPAPGPEGQFNSDDYPTVTGHVRRYAVTDPLSSYRYSVNFTLEGPWDFRQGPAQTTLSQEYIPVSSVPEHTRFPGAVMARRDNNGYSNRVFFYAWGAAEGRGIGNSYQDRDMHSAYFRHYSPGILYYRFPFRVGDSWSSQSRFRGTGYWEVTGEYSCVSTVVSVNTVMVPAGSYDTCYLVQSKTQMVWPDGSSGRWISYAWLVPGVGPVAYITSDTGEIHDVFTQASYIARLIEVIYP